MLRKILGGLVVVVAVLAAYLLLWPVPSEPEAWQPPESKYRTGIFAENDKLAGAERLVVPGHGPEDTTIGPDGLLYTGVDDGRIFRLPRTGGEAELFADTGGRPLGLQFNAAANLIVADAFKGLLSISPDGEITVLTDSVDGEKMIFVDDLDIASDGTIWFSDASTRFGYHDNLLDFMENIPSGRLVSYTPSTGETKVHLDGLAFANGVALGPDEAYVLVNETFRSRIVRLWLKGERAGQHEYFADNLPGLPDNLSFDGKSRFWVALVAQRTEQLDGLAASPWLRKVLVRIPGFESMAAPEPLGWVIALDKVGSPIKNLQDTTGNMHTITSVNQADGHLYLGSLEGDAVGRIKAP